MSNEPAKTAKPVGKERRANVIDSLIQNYGVPDEPLRVVLPKGDVLEFKVPSSLDDLKSVMSRAVKWWSDLPQAKGAAHPLSPFIPRTRESGVDAYCIAEFSVEPKFTQRQACEFIARAGWAAFAVSTAIKQHWRDMEAMWLAEAAVEAKKNSKGTSGDK